MIGRSSCAAFGAAIILCFAVAASAATFSSVRVLGPEKASPIEKFALSELSSAVANLQKPATAGAGELVIVVGRPETNPEVRRLTRRGIFRKPFAKAEKRAQGYALKFEKNKLLIAGADDPGTLYGVMDVVHYYLPKIASGQTTSLDLHQAPQIDLRGLWSWGGRVYNYEMFFDQMARWKLNLAVLWHETVPKDAAAIQDYAASRGVKLVWGFSWGWAGWAAGTNWNDPASIDQTEKKILDSFEKDYAPLQPSGIYFQSNTEGGGAAGQGEKFVGLVNRAASQILKKHPDHWISCGVHFSSFTRNWEVLKNIDPRLNIMYEDVGSMPFTYVSSLLNPKALDICPKLNALRGTGEDVGYIFKGFAAEMGGGGPQLIRDEEALKKLTAEHPADPGNEEGWRQNLSYGLQVLRGMAESPAKRKAVTMLMENGMWETRPWYPVCLTAEAMWDPHRKPEDLKLQLDQCRQVVSVAAGR